MTDTEKPVSEVEAAVGTETPPGADTALDTASDMTEPENPKATGEGPKSENPEERPKRPEYEVVPPKRETPETGFVADPAALALAMAKISGSVHPGGGTAKEQKARLRQASLEGMRKFAANPTRVYATIGIGLGLLVGLIVAVLFLHPNSATGQIDMGPANAAQYGLKGHLTTHWNGRLGYQVTIEPADASQAAAFAANVYQSPKPLSIEVQAKDPFGAVLCGDTILLRFDPRNAPGLATPEPGPKATRAEKERAERNQIAQGLKLAKLEGQELDREHGNNVFQNEVGKDGQIASLGAQGVLPCTRQQFERIASWGVTSNFPIVTPPAQDAGAAAEDARSAKEAAAEKAVANAKARRRPAPAVPPIYIEGDDAIVWIDATSGVMETQGGKVLLADKTDGVATALKERDFPIPIHYRCDQEGNCTFGGVGMGVHHARLRR